MEYIGASFKTFRTPVFQSVGQSPSFETRFLRRPLCVLLQPVDVSQPTTAQQQAASQDASLSGSAAAFLALLIASLLSPIWIQGWALWDEPYYRFFFAVPPAVLFLMYLRLQAVTEIDPGKPFWAGLWLGVSLFCLGLGTWVFSGFVCALGTTLLVIAVIYALGGAALTKFLLPPWLLLWTLTPWPLGLDSAAVDALKALAVDWASSLMDLLGILHLIGDQQLKLPKEELPLEMISQGAEFVLGAMAFAYFISIWGRRWTFHIVLMLILAVGWSLVAAMGHMVGTAYVISKWETSVTGHLEYQLSWIGLAVLLGFFIWSTDRFLLFLMPVYAIREGQAEDTAAAEMKRQGRLLREGLERSLLARGPALAGLGVVSVLSVAQLMMPLVNPLPRDPAQRTVATVVDEFSAATLPPQLNDQIVRTDFSRQSLDQRDLQGRLKWFYRSGNRELIYQLEYFSLVWKDPGQPFISDGWEVQDAVILDVPEQSTTLSTGEYWRNDLRRGGNEYILLFTTYLRPDGTIEPTYHHLGIIERGWQAFSTRLATFGQSVRGHEKRLFQFQCQVRGFRPLGTDERRQAQSLFLRNLEAIRTRFADQSSTP